MTGNAEGVTLCLAGDLTHPEDSITHYDTKTGGTPIFPTCLQPGKIQSVSCGVCDNPLSLVVQTYAPLAAQQAGRSLPERCLYIFGCTQAGSAQPEAATPSYRAPAQGRVLPEFYLKFRPEPGVKRDLLGRVDEQHMAQLLAEYEQSCGRAGQAPQVAESASCSVDGEPETWAGEGYEHASATGADSMYLKFSKRLQRCPQQCLRYSFGGKVLWPGSRPPAVPACDTCRRARVFEMQLMAPLIHLTEEAAEWLQGDGMAEQDLVTLLPDWDWLTVAVFTCPNSCESAGSEVVEECAVMFNESDAVTAQAGKRAKLVAEP
ncbi:hypothetical protein WJX72_005509 [[Myrmecia] bisecta]|uniref:Programmed cell death protein 2 C-terminal domain-containing protein n=1 Tax=[Myrmecia] bisecta TaxID=41462 RepID=A0AAW1PD94_9CHLO